MHEVALSESVARIVAKAAAGRHVTAVHLEIGALRQVVPESLTHAWKFVTGRTPLVGARLDVTWIPARIRCAAGHERDVSAELELDLLCTECDAPAAVIAGEEFRVVDIEVE